jgi:predicted O-methyltransferase YrrM
MEADATRAAEARRRFTVAGFGDRITVIAGDPRRFLYKIRGPFDLIVHNDPDDADDLHDRLIAMLAPGGVLIRGIKKYSQEI